MKAPIEVASYFWPVSLAWKVVIAGKILSCIEKPLAEKGLRLFELVIFKANHIQWPHPVKEIRRFLG